MDSLPTPGTVFLTSLLDIEEDLEKVQYGAKPHPTQQQSPPTSESKSTPATTGSVQDAPVQDYSQFQQEIERRFRQARESARGMNKPRVITPEQVVYALNHISDMVSVRMLTNTRSTIDTTPRTMSPEMKNEIFPPTYTPIDFDTGMSFSSTPIDLAMSESVMPDFDTFFSHSVQEPSFQYESPLSHEAVQEVYEPVPEMNTKRPLPVTTISDDLVVETAPKKAKTSLKKDGKPRNRRALSDSQVKQKRESFLERNRVAAMKCRSKRKDYVQQLHDDMRIRSEENEELRSMHKGLTDEIESLKNMLGRCDTRKTDDHDNEKMTATAEEMSEREKTDFMDVLIKEGPRRLG